MSQLAPQTLQFPVTLYEVKGYRFGQRVRSRIFLWARHLGDDIILSPGTPVRAVGSGKVVWSQTRLGNKKRRNWGGIVVIEHIHKVTGERFYSLYGHMTDLAVEVGQKVVTGVVVGKVSPGLSPENGWWKIPHLHFGIYVGPWSDDVLPGYKRFFERRTKFSWWRNPQQFIAEYNQG